MGKGLEVLEKLKKEHIFIDFELDFVIGEEYKDEFNVIEKELKALDFIRTWLKDDFFVYFKLEEDSICIDGSSYLPKEEYELLKEVLK